MPVDQQPCTTAFCEVHDASENAGVEEVHIVKDTTTYNVKDESTFKRASIADLEELISENEDIKQMIKVYINDPRESAESFLNNGIVDISLIDAPGLNRDSVKTTALFARQEEIDVVVFVVDDGPVARSFEGETKWKSVCKVCRATCSYSTTSS